MKVRELLYQLSKCNPDDTVVLSKDGEGNGFSVLFSIQNNQRYIGNKWDCEVWFRELTQELIDAGFSEEDVSEEGEDCIVLRPV